MVGRHSGVQLVLPSAVEEAVTNLRGSRHIGSPADLFRACQRARHGLESYIGDDRLRRRGEAVNLAATVSIAEGIGRIELEVIRRAAVQMCQIDRVCRGAGRSIQGLDGA